MQNGIHIWLWMGTMGHTCILCFFFFWKPEGVISLLKQVYRKFISCINSSKPCYLSFFGVFKTSSLIAYFTKLLKFFCKIRCVFVVLLLQFYTLSFLVYYFKMMSECGSKNKYKKRIKMVVEFLWVYFYLSVFVRLFTGVKCDFLLFFFTFDINFIHTHANVIK